MFFSTILTFFIVPATYIVLARLREIVADRRGVATAEGPEAEPRIATGGGA